MIPTKPSEAIWTDEQWKAIYAEGQDILVAAAAGSGKTAVLIERLIQKVLAPEDKRIDVDQLLVVTFTNASAAEMRNRMAEALEKAIAKDPHNQFLRRQLSLIGKAQISTLHSFCLSICRQYAYMIDLDPGFRIASQDEVALLRDDVLAQVLERAYGEQDDALTQEEVYRLVDSFTSDRSDQQIEKLIEQLYEMSRVQPNPYAWLRTLPNAYDVADDVTVDDLPFVKDLKKSIEHTLLAAHQNLQEMQKFATPEFGLTAYAQVAAEEEAFVRVALENIQQGTWQDLYDHMQKATWVRMPTVKKADNADEYAKKVAKESRDMAKDLVKTVKDTFFVRSPEHLVKEIRDMKPIIETLVKLTIAYSEAFKAAKLARGLVDFSDLEHYALEILTEKHDDRIIASAVAQDFQERFKEVLVDEYQDVNMLQETILQLVKSGGETDGNLFMVGDVKQSIYAFRLAEPRLFLRKYKTFLPSPQNTGMKIDLNANFRSRQEVLNSTNYVFAQVMDEKVGEIHYDDKAALKFSARYTPENVPVELVVLDEANTNDTSYQEEATDEEQEIEDIGRAQQEARYIIKRIQKMMDQGYQVYNPKDQTSRPIRYSDIVILMRSMKWSADLAEEFKAAGIPLYAESSKGYFDTLEVMIMLNLLKVIDNPYQDIPLASVLRAPFIGLNENELAAIRLAKRNVPYYEALKTYLADGAESIRVETRQKLDKFMLQLSEWRSAARRGSLADLIWDIYLKTNYYEMVGAMVNGKQRQANLRALHDRALAYENTSFRGLFRFLRFIDRMKSRGDDLGIAKSIGEADDVVRLVTIHSSKGLEFPVVFVAGLSSKFNMQDFNGSYLFDQDFGLAVKAIDPENRVVYTSLPYLAMKEKRIAKMKAEEMRILYVAMTRAKEKLIMVGSVKNWEKTKDKWEALQDLPSDVILPDYLRAGASSYLDWVGPAVARHHDFLTLSITDETPQAEVLTDALWQVTVLSNEKFRTKKDGEEDVAQEVVKHEPDEILVELLTKRFTADYPYKQATTKKSKTSVSEIKRFEAMQKQEEFEPTTHLLKSSTSMLARRPLFIQEKKMSTAEIGTVVHSVMQHVPQEGFTNLDEANAFLQHLVDRAILRQQEADVINMEDVLQFFASPLGERFKKATAMLREVPFTLSRADQEGDTQIVQGVIDCLFRDADGRWVLLDYKTDLIRPPFHVEPKLTEEMTNRYGLQLKIYAEAINIIKHIQVDEKVLYLYNIGESLTI